MSSESDCSNIFDLEQQILYCWHMVDDVDMLYKYIGDNSFFEGMEAKHHDEILNHLNALHFLYKLRFERMWNTFESVCEEYHDLRIASGKVREQQQASIWNNDE